VSQAAVKTLLKKGYKAKNLKGGMVRWALDVNTDFLEFL
jgi:rhodanese-related sulfurtransferase